MPSLSSKLSPGLLLALLVALPLLVAIGIFAWAHIDHPRDRISDAACDKANTVSGGCIACFPVNAVPDVLSELALSPKGDTLYAIDQRPRLPSKNSQLVAWATSDGTELWRRTLAGYRQSTAIAPTGDKIAAWTADATAPISLLSLPDGKLLGETSPVSLEFSDVAFNDTGSQFFFTPKGGQKQSASLRDGLLTMAPISSRRANCDEGAVGFGYLGEVSSRDGKIAVFLGSNLLGSRHIVSANAYVSASRLSDAICDASFVGFASPPSDWPGAETMYAIFSPDNKRLAIAYSIPDAQDYGGLLIQIRDLSHLTNEIRPTSMPLVATFPVNGAFPDLGWSPDGHRLAVIYETTTSRRRRAMTGGTLGPEAMQARIYAIP
jgi:hypothetical protein